MYNGLYSYCTRFTSLFGLQNRHICNTKQPINDWQCQQSFVDDALLIPKLNHKSALHHDDPVSPTNSEEQANVFFSRV